jgi:hypothetical protein
MERFTQSMAREYAVTWMIDPDQVYQQLRGQLAALRDSVFLSYSSKDEEMAVWLRDQFRKDNIAVWRDGDRIEAGAEWEDQLRQALGACRLMITLLSPDSLASNYVAREIRDFQTVNKKVFPVKVRPCEVPDGMASLQIVDATADREAAYFRLKRAVEDALGLRLP